MRRIDDENIGPFYELFEYLLCARRLQIKRHAPLVAIGEMPGIGILCDWLWWHMVRMPPQFTVRWLHLDYVSAEVRQDHRSTRAGDEARQVHHFQSGKNVVGCHSCPFQVAACRLRHRPRNFGARFSRKAEVPSFLSSVAAQMPK